MNRIKLIEEFTKKINSWESLDKEAFIADLMHWLTDKQVLIALNMAGPDFEDLKTEWLKGKDVK